MPPNDSLASYHPRVANTLFFMYAPHEHTQHPCHRAVSVACPGFITVADINADLKFSALLRQSRVEKGDTAKTCAATCTARPRGRNQNEILRVLRASKASTQRARRISVTSVLSFHLATENTEALLAREEIFAAQQRPRN
jgi:hypothetical protein